MGSKRHKGVLSKLKSIVRRHRLGELMMMNGLIGAGDLRFALMRQRATGAPLGRVLLTERLVSRKALYGVLAQQATIRSLVGVTALFLALSSFATRPARAGAIPDVPAQISLVGTANSAFKPIAAYPALFGTVERRSGSLDAFVKWTGMFDKLEKEIHEKRYNGTLTAWEKAIRPYAGMPLEEMASRVNSFVNEENYISDQDNWHVSDYWETPLQFFQRGGDCEDFAIAKYVSLRMLGVPENRLRIAIVQDKIKNMPHAILIVYSDHGALVLDNQVQNVRYAANVTRYRPIFTINRTAWWLHTSPTTTMVASAN